MESVWVDEEQLMLQDAVLTGTGFMVDGKRVDPQDVRLATAKVSSPELASLAAKYVDISASDWPEQSKDVAKFLHDVRSLAASVLAQAEPSK